jgi:hypothetical protein
VGRPAPQGTQKRVIPLVVNDGLVPHENISATLKSIHAMVCMMTHGEHSTFYLEDTGVGIDGLRCTTATSRVSGSCL